MRDWTYVEDNADALWLVLTEGKRGRIYNVGAGNGMRNRELTYAVPVRIGLEGDKTTHESSTWPTAPGTI